MMIEYIIQNPGQMEQDTTDYKGYKYRTVIFNDEWVDAQFFEISGRLIEKWKAGEKITSNNNDNYSSMNCSLVPRNFTVIYHNDVLST